MTPGKTIETRTEVLTVEPSGIIRCTVKPTAEHTLADAEENVRAIGELMGEVRLKILLDARNARSITREARAHYTGPTNAEFVWASAMLIGSAVGRIIGNFMTQVNRPLFHLRLFSDEDAAYAWLHGLGAVDADDRRDR